MASQINNRFSLVGEGKELHLRRSSQGQYVKNCLRACLLTTLGERAYYPEAGTPVRDFVFKPLTTSVRQQLSQSIEKSIKGAQLGIELNDLELSQSETSGTGISISLSYRSDTGSTDRITVHV